MRTSLREPSWRTRGPLRRDPRTHHWTRLPAAATILAALLGVAVGVGAASAPAARPETKGAGAGPPNVLLITIDALRSDRLSIYGYDRPTSPNLDRLLADGARFTEARAVEPLTNPSLSSMITSLYPHEHGGTRNGLRMRRGLNSLPKVLADRGYLTAAFVGNWTLRNRLSGLGEHFETYQEVLTKRRWFGLFKGEANGADLTDRALEWLDQFGGHRRPFLLWVHYVEPHAPYVFHPEFAHKLGIETGHGEPSKSDRYDTEIAFADQQVGRLLAAVEGDPRMRRRTLVFFAADHGESLGEHGYWGHGRNLHEPNLHIPLGVVWPGHIRPQVIDAPAVLIDTAPTVLGLLGVPEPQGFHGQDWSRVFRGAEAPADRTTWYQAHKGAVLTAREAKNARSAGLLQVGMLTGSMKEILEVPDDDVQVFDLGHDPSEVQSLVADDHKPSEELKVWYQQVEAGLDQAGHFPPPVLDEESVEQLKSLGYGG